MAQIWRSKPLGKYSTDIVVRQWDDVQEFQGIEFLVIGVDQLRQMQRVHHEADAAHAIVVSEGKLDTLFILWSEIPSPVNVIDEERKGG